MSSVNCYVYTDVLQSTILANVTLLFLSSKIVPHRASWHFLSIWFFKRCQISDATEPIFGSLKHLSCFVLRLNIFVIFILYTNVNLKYEVDVLRPMM